MDNHTQDNPSGIYINIYSNIGMSDLHCIVGDVVWFWLLYRLSTAVIRFLIIYINHTLYSYARLYVSIKSIKSAIKYATKMYLYFIALS